jgi:spore coat protein A
MPVDRRKFLKLGLAGAVGLALPVGRAVQVIEEAGADVPSSPPVPKFAQPLRFAPVIDLASPGTPNEASITMTTAAQQVLTGHPPTTIWGFNGIWPGPTILTRDTKPVVIHMTNGLAVPTTIHHHGADEAAIDDGHPLNLLQPLNGPQVVGRPGDVFFPEPTNQKDYHWPARQPAATMWYHDHAIDETGRNVYMGLGAFQPHLDAATDALPLPAGLGGLAAVPFDIPIVVQDRIFNNDGSFFFEKGDNPFLPPQQGNFGDVICVNGVPFPFFQVARRKYRFRLLNGSNSRFYQMALSTREPFTMIGTDGGLLAHPVDVATFVIGPAERYEFVLDFSKYPIGTSVVLENHFEPGAFGDPTPPDKTRQIMRFDVVVDASDPSSVPADLVPLPNIDPAQSVRTRDWVFERDGGAWVINQRPYGRGRIDAFPALGSTEIWRFINESGGWIHPVHVHLIEWLILDRNGRPPLAHEQGPKDVVYLGTGETIRVAIKFESFKGIYAMHCHNLAHEDHDMMTQFETS